MPPWASPVEDLFTVSNLLELWKRVEFSEYLI